MFLPELQIMHYKCFQCLSFTKSLIFCPKDQLAAKQQKSQKKTNQPGKRRWISRASDGRLLTDGAQCERGQDVTDVGALLPTGRPMHEGPRCNNSRRALPRTTSHFHRVRPRHVPNSAREPSASDSSESPSSLPGPAPRHPPSCRPCLPLPPPPGPSPWNTPRSSARGLRRLAPCLLRPLPRHSFQIKTPNTPASALSVPTVCVTNFIRLFYWLSLSIRI